MPETNCTLSQSVASCAKGQLEVNSRSIRGQFEVNSRSIRGQLEVNQKALGGRSESPRGHQRSFALICAHARSCALIRGHQQLSVKVNQERSHLGRPEVRSIKRDRTWVKVNQERSHLGRPEAELAGRCDGRKRRRRRERVEEVRVPVAKGKGLLSTQSIPSRADETFLDR